MRKLIASIVVLLLLAVAALIVVPGVLSSKRAANERHASAALKTLASAQADFTVELKTMSDKDLLLLAKIEKKATLLDTVRVVTEGALRNTPGKMEEGDELLVPCLNFDLRKKYEELRRTFFSAPPTATPYFIDQAYQAVLFRLDETGVRLESWAGIYSKLNGDTPPPPRKIFFDGPFLILLMKTGAKTPYFAAWIEDPELLCAR